jgi:hypothetical protein
MIWPVPDSNGVPTVIDLGNYIWFAGEPSRYRPSYRGFGSLLSWIAIGYCVKSSADQRETRRSLFEDSKKGETVVSDKTINAHQKRRAIKHPVISSGIQKCAFTVQRG